MKIIPVIDILSAQAVSAYRGERHRYRPRSSPLCRSPHPGDLLQAYLDLYPFTTVYIADLDAIQGTGDNLPLITELAREFPAVELWLDHGGDAVSGAADNIHPVLGTETGCSVQALDTAMAADPRLLLSLDFDQHGLLGDAGILRQPPHWPRRCLVMTLARVGAGSGPDTALLQDLRARAPGHDFYAAGGVRDAGDLHALATTGAAGALIASALHSGAITRTDLQALQQ